MGKAASRNKQRDLCEWSDSQLINTNVTLQYGTNYDIVAKLSSPRKKKEIYYYYYFFSPKCSL